MLRAHFDLYSLEIDWELKGCDFTAKFMPREARDGGLLGFSSSPHQGKISHFW